MASYGGCAMKNYLLEVLKKSYQNYREEEIKDKSIAIGKLEGMVEFIIMQLEGRK